MKLTEIRKNFLKYFDSKDHEIISSSDLIPHGDDSILFTNAGMVQFKDVFLGLEKRTKSATSSQKCLRVGGKHNDLENVGFTTRHQTFFEMLGNFSFGQYFKEQAIEYAWEFLTDELKIPQEKLFITVHQSDDESEQLWLNNIGISKDKIARLGDEDNFWSMGETGPCGPCSEIFYDYGENFEGSLPGEGDTGDRYVEIWNLVFMEFNRNAKGELTPLPNKCVDTGMGLERICSVMQNVGSNFETDLFKDLKINISKKFETPNDQSLNVVADHLRAAFFLMSENVMPSNEGRGYVLRRIIRRAVRHGYKMDRKTPFLYECLENLRDLIENDFKEEFTDFPRYKLALEQEEKLFFKTLSSGMKILEQELSKDLKIVSGEIAFKLHDTYGFPIDLTRTISQEKNLSIDEVGFEKLMAIQKQGSKQSSMFNAKDIVIDPNLSSNFIGHDKTSCEANCIALFDEEGTSVDKISSRGFAIFSETPFYAEMGGQVGDIGSVVKKGSEIKVIDCKKVGNFHLHEVEISSGELTKNDNAKLLIDLARREKIECNHSATHLLHSALRETLGDAVQQKGSLVNDEKLRFDFSHGAKLTQPEIESIEKIVNSQIESSSITETKTMSFQDALDSGALAFFGDKYGDEVRVVSLGGKFSVELCGGTHVKNTSEIEGFIISNETSVSSGVRRIEAMTGSNLVKKSKEALTTIKELSEILNVPQEELVGRISDVLKENKNLKSGKKAEKSLSAEELRSSNLTISGNSGEIKLYKNASVEMLRRFSDKSLKDVEFCFSVFISMDEDRLSYIVTAKKEKNLSAKEIIAYVNDCFSGSGGGRDDFAQGGSQDLTNIEAKFEKLEESLKIID